MWKNERTSRVRVHVREKRNVTKERSTKKRWWTSDETRRSERGSAERRASWFQFPFSATPRTRTVNHVRNGHVLNELPPSRTTPRYRRGTLASRSLLRHRSIYLSSASSLRYVSSRFLSLFLSLFSYSRKFSREKGNEIS